MLRESKDFGNKFDNELSELRINNRVKTEELERMRIDYEEKLAEYRNLSTQNDMLKDKISVLRSEFFKAEARHKDDSSEYRAKVVVLEERLKNYENIEQDIDQAVIGIGSSNNPDNLYLRTIGMAPTSTQRRVQQAISLAQKLNEKQKELDQARSQLRTEEDKGKRAQEELQMTQELLSKTKHPSAYLVSNLESKEKENLELKRALVKATNEKDYLVQENNDLQNVVEG